MRLHYCKVSTIYIYSVIADVRLPLWQRIVGRPEPRIFVIATMRYF